MKLLRSRKYTIFWRLDARCTWAQGLCAWVRIRCIFEIFWISKTPITCKSHCLWFLSLQIDDFLSCWNALFFFMGRDIYTSFSGYYIGLYKQWTSHKWVRLFFHAEKSKKRHRGQIYIETVWAGKRAEGWGNAQAKGNVLHGPHFFFQRSLSALCVLCATAPFFIASLFFFQRWVMKISDSTVGACGGYITIEVVLIAANYENPDDTVGKLERPVFYYYTRFRTQERRRHLCVVSFVCVFFESPRMHDIYYYFRTGIVQLHQCRETAILPSSGVPKDSFEPLVRWSYGCLNSGSGTWVFGGASTGFNNTLPSVWIFPWTQRTLWISPILAFYKCPPRPPTVCAGRQRVVVESECFW